MTDAVVIGAGPNGLTAAIVLARAGLEVLVVEAAGIVGGGARTAELTLPGFHHDTCSSVHPWAAASPVLRSLPLEQHGLRWIEPDLPLAHPFPDGSAAVLARSPAQTARSLGEDATSYLRLVRPFLRRFGDLADDVLRPPLAGLPSHVFLMARFGMRAVMPAAKLVGRFHGSHARGMFAGLAAHGLAPLESPVTGGMALMFALAGHAAGWPFPRSGAGALSRALAAELRRLGGRIELGHRVRSIAELPAARAYVFDVSPDDLLAIAGEELPRGYERRLRRFRYGPAAFKIDYALDGPVPWTAPDCRTAGTVHLGPSYPEIDSALRAVHNGEVTQSPFLIATQPSVFDPTRAPEGKHVLWVYGHVPNGWRGDLTAAIERQIDRFAPGFAHRVLARSVSTPADIEARNPNNVGGDVATGNCEGFRALIRPVLRRVPYTTGNPAIYLCSAATSPGPGVHGMCGYHAAQAVLRRLRIR